MERKDNIMEKKTVQQNDARGALDNTLIEGSQAFITYYEKVASHCIREFRGHLTAIDCIDSMGQVIAVLLNALMETKREEQPELYEEYRAKIDRILNGTTLRDIRLEEGYTVNIDEEVAH
jgi:hypothetical protein